MVFQFVSLEYLYAVYSVIKVECGLKYVLLIRLNEIPQLDSFQFDLNALLRASKKSSICVASDGCRSMRMAYTRF